MVICREVIRVIVRVRPKHRKNHMVIAWSVSHTMGPTSRVSGRGRPLAVDGGALQVCQEHYGLVER